MTARGRGAIYFASFLAAPRLTTIQFAFRPINRASPAHTRILHPLGSAEGAGERSPRNPPLPPSVLLLRR